jgi:Fe-S-cluster containining protein
MAGRRRKLAAPKRGPSRAQKMARLVGELTSDPAYGMGETPFPRRVTDDEGVAIAEALHAELDEGTIDRAALAETRGLPIACERGCNACCEELVIVELPEALAVAHWLATDEGAAARAAFLEAYPRWRAAAGDAIDAVATLAHDDTRRDEYEALHRAQWRKRLLCAFNQDGDCTIYPARPLVCRNAHAVETRERCVAGSPIPARRLTFPLVDGFLERSAFLLRATHRAMTGGPAEALCSAVHRLLTQAPPAPR